MLVSLSFINLFSLCVIYATGIVSIQRFEAYITTLLSIPFPLGARIAFCWQLGRQITAAEAHPFNQ